MSIFTRMALGACLLWPALALAAGPVDINTADAATLAAAINGVGPTKAEAIVAYRTKHGPFKSVDDLTLVQGIGQKTVDVNREALSVGSGAGD